VPVLTSDGCSGGLPGRLEMTTDGAAYFFAGPCDGDGWVFEGVEEAPGQAPVLLFVGGSPPCVPSGETWSCWMGGNRGNS